MISLDDDFEKAKRFIDKKGYDFPIFKIGSNIPEVFHSNAIPTTFVISPEGMIVVKKSGMAKYNTEEFRNYLKEMGD
jgi:peroxiredoxin